MNELLKEAIDAVGKLNYAAAEVLQMTGETYPIFQLTTEGEEVYIDMLGYPVFSSADDERGYDDNEDEYEPLEGFLKGN